MSTQSKPANPEQELSLRAAGRKLRVSVRRGDGTRTPLLLINGIGAPLELLQPFVDVLDPSLEVIRFDVPGVGGSPLPVLPYTIGTLCLSIASLLEQLGHSGRVDVMGFSWGGAVAQHFAVQHRRRTRKLLLAATSAGVLMVPAHPQVLMRMATPRRHRDPAYAQRVAGELYGGTARDEPSSAAALLHPQARRGPRRGYYYQLAAATGWSSLGYLPVMQMPTLILCGDDDPLIPVVNARIMARLLPKSTLHIYRGGHLELLSHAAELAPVVEEFLAYRACGLPTSPKRR